jgi:hypothetical protein
MVNAQVSFHFLGFHRLKEWREFPVLAGICRKCGWMNFHAATPSQLAARIDS